MRDNLVLQVFCKWSAGRFLFWGLDEAQRPLDAMNLKLKLFAWHQDSYYGTFLEEDIINGISAVVLPADQALNYFRDLPQGEYIQFQWSKEIKQLQNAALAIQKTIALGQWQPDYGKWLKGQNGWQFNLPDNVKAMELPYLDSWLDAIMVGYLESNPELQQSWQSLLAEYPLLKPRDLTEGSIVNEDEWLTTIGWQRDETPFKICLQLAEPEDGVTWTLGILLQDKANTQMMKEYPLLRFRYSHGQQPNGHVLPTSWLPFLDKVNTYITRWLQILPWLKTEEGDLKTYLSEEEAWNFLTNGSLALVEAGYTVFLPSWWEQLRKNKPKLKVQTKSSFKTSGESMFGLQDLVQFNWKLALGNVELSEDEFRGLVREKRRLIKFRGQWIQLDPRVLAEISNTIKQQRKGLTLGEVLQIHLLGNDDAIEQMDGQRENSFKESTDIDQELADIERGIMVEVELNTSLTQMIRQLTHNTSLEALDPPQNFRGHLRNYQLLGFSWMLFLRKFGLGGCLADDMGLGKTIQFIAYLLAIKENRGAGNLGFKPALLICPTSVIGNWQIELERFAPDLEVYIHYGNQRSKGENLVAEIRNQDLVITSYNLASLDQESLQTQEWDCLCLDEAQNIKNAYTKQAKAIRTFKANQRLALTGTPMENRLTELWSIMDFANPGYLGSFSNFSRKFVKAIEINRDSARIELLQRLVQPFILRRLKTDPQIEIDLPDKQEYKEYLPLTSEQASLYENTLDEMSEKLEHATSMARRGVILGTLTKLKQVCNHPNLLLKESHQSNYSYLPTRSTKVERLLAMVEELRAEGDKCLIFTQFVEMGHLLQRVLQQKLEEPVLFLHGGVPKKQRDTMIKEFQNEDLIGKKQSQNNKQVGIFILSLKAGGTGLNLTAANHVFHVDRWWNPAVENQATDRAHRIGQTRKVLVHKLITLGTLESRIDEMLTKKQKLNQLIMGHGESWVTELSNSEIRELFALRRDWVVSD